MHPTQPFNHANKQSCNGKEMREPIYIWIYALLLQNNGGKIA